MLKRLLMLVLFVAPLSLCAQKYAHFDYASIMQAMPEYKKAQTELETMGKQYQTELENLQKELQTKAEAYQKTDADPNTPQNMKDRHQQELQDMYQRFQQAQQTKMQPITQKVMDAVNAVAKDGGYVYIMDKNAAQGAGIVINETLSTDVTNTVMQKLGITASKPAAGK